MKFSEAVTKLYENHTPHRLLDVKIYSDCEFDDISILDPAQSTVDSGTLYFVDASTLEKATPIPSCMLYYGTFPKSRESEIVNCIKIEQKDMASIFQTFKSMMDGNISAQKTYADMLHMFLTGVDLNTILTTISDRTGDLFAVIDSTGKILARTSNFYVNYPLWMQSIDKGYCSEVLMGYIEELRKKNNYSLSPVPFSLFCEHLKMYILVSRVIYGNSLMGYVFIINKEGVFSAQNQQMIPLIANSVREIAMRYISDSGFSDFQANQLNNILMDIISGVTTNETELRITLAKLKFPMSMRAMILRPLYIKEDTYLQNELRPGIAAIFGDCPSTIQHSSLITLVAVDEQGKIPDGQLSALREFAKDNYIQIGISNAFTQTRDIAAHYDQAKRALSFAKRIKTDDKIFFFSDYIFYVLFDQMDDNNIFSYVRHPALDILAAFDAEKGSDLYNTLKVYAQAGFNKIKAAELLFLHRNTVNYRIQQIENLCNIDLSNTDLLFPLQLSFIIDSYLNNEPIN
jgi:hypothetical protein